MHRPLAAGRFATEDNNVLDVAKVFYRLPVEYILPLLLLGLRAAIE